MPGSITFVAVMVFLSVAALVYYIGMGIVRSRSADRLSAMHRSRQEVLGSGFSERAIAPIFETLGGWALRFTPVGWARRTQQRLVLAGVDDSIDVNGWAAIRLLSIGGALLVWLLVQTQLDQVWEKLIVLGLLGFVGFFTPEGILNHRIDERRNTMRRELPDILDLLVISVEAGLSFEAALTRVARTVPGLMSEEFGRMLQETRVGVSRTEAMRHLADRTDLDELRSFLLAMNQAEMFGVSVSRVLRVQADEMRSKRRQRAQERAFTAPVKMVFPLVFCILPALFVVLLGPAAIEIFRDVINR